MSTGTDCKLYIDGARFADGTPGEDPAAPFALSGLSIAWGRDTTVDQPSPATCSFEVSDPAGGALRGALAVGALVEVTATATIWGPPAGASTFLDPGFEADPVAVLPRRAVVAATADRPRTGARSLRVDPADPARRWTLDLPPAPFAPPGASPGAWDAIPATAPGQEWSAGVWVHAPAGCLVSLAALLYTGPWTSAAVELAPSTELDGGGGWTFLAVRFAAEAAGRWVGLRVSAYPTGPPWADEPGTWAAATGTWRDRARVYLDDVEVQGPQDAQVRGVLVYSGRVTDIEAAWDDSTGGPLAKVSAADFLADLDNRDVGDEPWDVEAMGARFERILGLSGLPIRAEIDPGLYPVPVSWRDVDRQGAAALLGGLAETVDGVLWPAVHQTTGAYLRVEDPAARPALFALMMGGAGLVVIAPAPAAGAIDLSACDVLRDPVAFTLDVAGLATRAAVSWLEQTTDDQGKRGTAEHTVVVVDDDLETRHGTRRVSLSTQLIDAPAARDVADKLMSRLSVEGWRASGFAVDDDDLDDAAVLLALIDGTSRIGLPIRITDLPEWAPVPGGELPVYLEGGELDYLDGRWTVQANVSGGHGVGDSVTWAQLDPAWAWAQLDPAIRWLDLRGVAGPQEMTP